MVVVSEPSFRPGIEVARDFWEKVVRPILATQLPDAPWQAALIGTGSEVLGFDTVRSTDHSWGRPNLMDRRHHHSILTLLVWGSLSFWSRVLPFEGNL